MDPCSSTFDEWWESEGCKIKPLDKESADKYIRRISIIAWMRAAREVVSRINDCAR